MPLLDHVGGRVTDLDRSVQFYCDLFGFEMVDRRMLGNSNVEAAAMQVGGSIIFLLHSTSFRSRSLGEHGGVDHFCLTFTESEFREILERVKVMGVRVEGGVVPRTGATGRSDSQYILDLDGNQIEVKKGLD